MDRNVSSIYGFMFDPEQTILPNKAYLEEFLLNKEKLGNSVKDICIAIRERTDNI